MTAPPCTCDQHGDYCDQHPTCACGCQRHAHRGGACIAGKLTCYGCDGYRPARIQRFEALFDEDVGHATIDELRLAYKALRGHHVEETTALWSKLSKGVKP